MIFYLREFQFDYVFPATQEPPWSSLVERWYQLDAFAYGLVQAYTEFKSALQSPDLMILASPEASNRTDLLFARGGAASPSKFVHTLPNVRGAPLSQVMNWSGPSLCIQSDPRTELSGVEQALLNLESNPMLNTVWVLSSRELDAKHFRVRFYQVARDHQPTSFDESPGHHRSYSLKKTVGAADLLSDDIAWHGWLKNSGTKSTFQLSKTYVAIRSDG